MTVKPPAWPTAAAAVLLAAGLIALVLTLAFPPPAYANDTIKAVRADMAAAAAKQSQVDQRQNARLDALEQDVAALKAAGQSPPPVVVEPPPASVYPKGVAAIPGLAAVFDARPGPSVPLTRLAAPPPGATRDATGNLWWRGGGALSAVDLEGLDVWFNAGVFTVSQARFHSNPGGFYRSALGHVNGGPGAASVTITDATFDLETTGHMYGPVLVTPGSTLTIKRASFIRGGHILLFVTGGENNPPPATTTIEDVYFGAFASTVVYPDHTEQAKMGPGVHVMRRVFLDARAMAGATNTSTTVTAQAYFEADQGDVTATVEDCIMAGGAGIKTLAAIQAAAKNGRTLTLTLKNCALQRAGNPAPMGVAADYIRPSLINGGATGFVKIIATNVRDYDTGALLDDQLNALSLPAKTAANDNAAPAEPARLVSSGR